MVGAKEHRTTDTEMSDVMAMQQQQVPNDNNVRELLTLARQLINQANPSQALQAVVMAMRTKGGDQAVFQSLHRARELYLNRLQESTAADQLASLFAECAIAEAQPLQDEQTPLNVGDQSPSAVPDVNVNSILAETGRAQFMFGAFSDGSSFICLKCGGLGVMPSGGVLTVSVFVGVCAQIPRDSPETRHRERKKRLEFYLSNHVLLLMVHCRLDL
uniref:C2HC zinc finger plants domain-containing protein n=1 Tax=Salix viminalis TaxID=40686 RepID=A0A6N2MKV3_SALVM